MSTSLIKDEARALYKKACELEKLADDLDVIRPSDYVLVKTEGPYPAYVGRFTGVVKAKNGWRIKLNKLALVYPNEGKYEIGSGREFLKIARDIAGMSTMLRESTKHMRGRRALSKEEMQASVEAELNSYYPAVDNPRYVGVEIISEALKEYNLSWDAYRKAVEETEDTIVSSPT
jgi:hypothetical protein